MCARVKLFTHSWKKGRTDIHVAFNILFLCATYQLCCALAFRMGWDFKRPRRHDWGVVSCQKGGNCCYIWRWNVTRSLLPLESSSLLIPILKWATCWWSFSAESGAETDRPLRLSSCPCICRRARSHTQTPPHTLTRAHSARAHTLARRERNRESRARFASRSLPGAPSKLHAAIAPCTLCVSACVRRLLA